MPKNIQQIEQTSYLVGGAVRDEILKIDNHDYDFVVVGITPQEMLDAGFELVGEDFPVFLHPIDGSEYALARTERKVGQGHTGFVTNHDTSVTLTDDLIRRDLTINSIAMNSDGELVDPFNGLQDIETKTLRATSDAFKEDPLRVLRLARFYAKLGAEWSIEEKTAEMCRQISMAEEFHNLTSERVGQELLKALGTKQPWLFFTALDYLGALEVHFPELKALQGQTQPEKWHPEGDAYTHTLLVLRAYVGNEKEVDLIGRFCALTHDLGKGLTPKDKLPHHYGHEAAGVPVVDQMCNRLKLSNEYRKAARISAKWHGHVHNAFKMNANTWANIAEEIKNSDYPDFHRVGKVGLADSQGRGTQFEKEVPPNAEAWQTMLLLLTNVRAKDLFTDEELETVHFSKIKDAIRKRRVLIAKHMIKTWKELPDIGV